MIRLKIKDALYKLIDGYQINESSREVKFSDLKLDFTDKTIADLPLKYQECQLVDADLEDIEASEGSTVEGTDLQLIYDDKRYFNYSLKGNTSQETTTGKNLLANDLATRTENGITITKNTDGTYKVNGTATADISLAINNDFVAMSGTWRMLGCPAGGSASTYMLSAYVGYWGGGSPNIDTGNGTNITYTGNVKVRFYIKSGTTCNNLIFKPMITTDTSTTINNWERYTGGIASPNPNYPQEAQTVSGRQEVEIVGKNLFDKNTSIVIGKTWTSTGTETNLTNCFVQESYIPATPSTAYTISTTNDYSSTTDFRLMICEYDTNKNFIRRNIGTVGGGITTKYTITTSSTAHYVRLGASTITIDELQFEKGNQATTYEEYKGQTYELDLGKNMLSLTDNQVATNAGIRAQVQHGWIILNGTATANSIIRLSIKATTVYADESYTLSANNTSQVSGSGIILSVGNTADSYTQTNFSSVNAKRTFKKDSATTYNRLTISTASGTTYNNYIIKPQLEKGTKATEYSDYKEPIELCKIGNYQDRILKNTGLNLYDKDAGNILNAYFNASQTTIANNSANRMIYIPCKPNTTYTLSKIRSAQFNIGYTKELPAENVQVYGINTSPTFYNDNSWYYFTITTPADAQYIVSRIYQTAQDTTITLDQVLGTIQLEEGNTPSAYEPFGSGSWYLYKAINKVVLNGSESWGRGSSATTRSTYLLNTFDDRINSTSMSNFYSDNFKYVGNAQTTDIGYAMSFNTGQYSNFLYIQVPLDVVAYNQVANFKSWLSQHPTSVYYILEAPETTVIEDTDLLKQLDAISLLNGINYITVSSSGLTAIMNLHYNYNNAYLWSKVNKIIYTGYVNNYKLPGMKNKKEYRELELELLSPLAMATLRTVDAVGTYNLKNLILEIIQPLIDDGFKLKEYNAGNNQITVNFLTETVESALNKLSNKYDFWWYIDENKNIYINSINYLLAKTPKLVYDKDNKINGLVDFTPSIDATDYCNTIDFSNVRLYTNSNFLRYDWHEPINDIDVIQYEYYYPLIKKDFISPGEEIEFDIPFVINTKKRGTTQGTLTHITEDYFNLYKINSERNYEQVLEIAVDSEGNAIIPNNAVIEDSYSGADETEFVFVKDPFFSNLIIGMKYNGTTQIEVGSISSATALVWAKVKINDAGEIEKNKNLINLTGIVEKQIDMNEQWKTYEELVDIANSYIKKNDSSVEKVQLVMDVENNLNVGDLIDIDKMTFFTSGRYIITDKKLRYETNVNTWTYNLTNTNILENYVDLFRAGEKEEEFDKVYSLITSNYTAEGIKEKYEVDVL